MKISILFLLLLHGYVFAQNPSHPPPPLMGPVLNELTIGLIPSSDKELNGKMGYSIGAYRVIFQSRPANIIIGVEFGHNYQYENSEYGDRTSQYSNLTYDFKSLVFPIMARINIGSKQTAFIDLGGFIGSLGGTKSGFSSGYVLPYRTYTNVHFSRRLDDNATVAMVAGLGITIPVGRVKLLGKISYSLSTQEYIGAYSHVLNNYLKFSLGVRLPDSRRSIRLQEEWDAKYLPNPK